MKKRAGMRLKANKTSLYKLVLDKEKLMPPMGKTMFCKVPRTTSYFMDWWCPSTGSACKAYLAPVMGMPTLTIENPVGRKVYRLTVDDLRERGMIEEAET